MEGISLLHTATGIGHSNLVGFFIKAGADVNAPDIDVETPLHQAMSRKSNHNVAWLLLENGADITTMAVGGTTPLHAISNNTIGLVLFRGSEDA